jgi:hypothetical protein
VQPHDLYLFERAKMVNEVRAALNLNRCVLTALERAEWNEADATIDWRVR